MKNECFRQITHTEVSSLSKQPQKKVIIQPQFYFSLQYNSSHINANDHMNRLNQHSKNKKHKELKLKKYKTKQSTKSHFQSIDQTEKIITKQSQVNIQKIDKINDLTQELTNILASCSQVELAQCEFLNPLREILINFHQKLMNKNKKEVNIQNIENIKKNNFRDLAKLYTQIIETTPTYNALYLGLKKKLNTVQYQNLQNLHIKMSKGGSRHDILQYRKCSQTIKNIIQEINSGTKLHHQIMLSDKNIYVKMQFLSRLEQMFIHIKEMERNIIE